MLLKVLSGLGRTLVQVFLTRMEILSLDVKEAQIRFVTIVMLSAFAFLSFALGIVLATVLLIFAFWESYRLLVVGILAGALLILGFGLLFALLSRLKRGPWLFQASMDELEKDIEALGGRPKGRR